MAAEAPVACEGAPARRAFAPESHLCASSAEQSWVGPKGSVCLPSAPPRPLLACERASRPRLLRPPQMQFAARSPQHIEPVTSLLKAGPQKHSNCHSPRHEPSPLKNLLRLPKCFNGNYFQMERELAREPKPSFLKMNHVIWPESGPWSPHN